MKKITSLFVRLLNFVGILRKEEKSDLFDAIQLPYTKNQMVVEDFEMAAYHNQA